MTPEENYLDINRRSWNERTETHLGSSFYDMDRFLAGHSSLNSTELDLLGDVRGKSILHLQCHFGQDSISLSRLGASVTGVDLSDKAIAAAEKLAAETGSGTRFICCDLYSLPQHLDEQFDLVFTSYGTIGWLPDLDRWAAVVAQFLKPGGSFVFAEFHPVVWMFDNDFSQVGYRYFNSGPIHEYESGTYADRDAELHTQTISWNHGIGEVINSLISHGLDIRSLEEFDFSHYNCFRHTEEFAPGKFRIAHLGDKIPMMYALKAVLPANDPKDRT